jgi:hypothetical protein
VRYPRPRDGPARGPCIRAVHRGALLLRAHVGKDAHDFNAADAAQRARGRVRACSLPLLRVAMSSRPLVRCTTVRASKEPGYDPPLSRCYHGLGRRPPVPVGQAPRAVLLHGLCAFACAAVSSGACILPAPLRVLARTELAGVLRRLTGGWLRGAGVLVRCGKTRDVGH